MKFQISNFKFRTARAAAGRAGDASIWNSKFAMRNFPAFTLIEMLVVITILGILAALTVPALKNLGKSNIQVNAVRQMLDDVARARQLAMSQRTTVYMVFVPINYWSYQSAAVNAQPITTNLCDKQFTGYNFVTLRSVGDQPGQGVPQYLSEWKVLPEGAFLAVNKFNTSFNYPNGYTITNYSYNFTNKIVDSIYPIYSFNYTNNLPFPVETNFNSTLWLPFIAFNYLGQLTMDGLSLSTRDEYIPLAQGHPAYAVDANKAFKLSPATFAEEPPGNSTDSMFNVIHIDRLTGRAALLQQKLP
jgi:prepilin-type N-terminal cleavage/methylation domain-containing protein